MVTRQVAGVMVTVHARIEPVSPIKKSWASRLQVPLAVSPSKAVNGALGVKLPVNGAFADATD